MEMENKKENEQSISDFDLESKKFLIASQQDTAEIKVKKTGIMTTKYGEKKYISDGYDILLLNKTMEQKLVEQGYHSGAELIGAVLHLKSVPVVVQGSVKKMWIIEKIDERIE